MEHALQVPFHIDQFASNFLLFILELSSVKIVLVRLASFFSIVFSRVQHIYTCFCLIVHHFLIMLKVALHALHAEHLGSTYFIFQRNAIGHTLFKLGHCS